LKRENPLYEDVTISDENISQLLENDIPVEIVVNVKHSEETMKLEKEREGYVDEDEASEIDRERGLFIMISGIGTDTFHF